MERRKKQRIAGSMLGALGGAAVCRLAACCWALGGSALLQAEESEKKSTETAQTLKAERKLKEFGLTKFGYAWLNEDELRLRKLLDEHDSTARRLRRAEAARWELLLHRLSAAMVEAAPEKKPALQQALSDAAEHGERLAKLLRTTAPRPNPQREIKPDELRRVLLEAAAAQWKVLVDGEFTVRTTDEALEKQYAVLEETPECRQALVELGATSKLGPLRKYDSFRRSWERLTAEGRECSAPLIPQDGRFFAAVSFDGRKPLLFELRPDDELSLAPAEWVPEVRVPENQKGPENGAEGEPGKQQVRLSMQGQAMQVTLAKLPPLRLGPHVLRDVQAALLPADARQVQARLGASAFAGFAVELDFERLILRLRPIESSGYIGQ